MTMKTLHITIATALFWAFFIPIVGVVCLALDSYLMLRQASEYMRS